MRSGKCEVSSLQCEVRSGKFEDAAIRRPRAAGASACEKSEGTVLLTSHFKLHTSHFQPRPFYFRRGFTLVETLAATMILSGAVLTLGAISNNALTNTRLYRHYELAASVIDIQLTLIDQVGIDRFIEAGQMEGVYDQFDPSYQWVVTTEYTGTDNLYRVTITVTWLEGRRPYRMTAQTMLNAASSVPTGPEEQQTQ
jgi:prepilin-type N-terminal cleavage/methylation domain-containing protein